MAFVSLTFSVRKNLNEIPIRKNLNEIPIIGNKQFICPKCGSDNIIAKGTKGATGRNILEIFFLGGLLGAFIRKTIANYADPQNLQYKCKECGNTFVLETILSKSQEELKTDCKIILHRGKSPRGALMPFYVYLNGRQVGAVKNGHSIEFITNIKFNTINVTDTNGNAFKDTYLFNAIEGEEIEVYFNRKFVRNQ